MDIRRLARECRLDARTTFHQEQSQFSRAEVQRHSRGSRWKVIPKLLFETAQTIQETEAIWHESCKESQKREEDLWTHAEELRTQGGKDDRIRKVLVDGFRRLK